MYATLIVSKPANSDRMRHIIVARLGDTPVIWHRTTNGKQGRGNAWVLGPAPVEDMVTDTMYGEPVSFPVTPRDILDWSRTGTPSSLFTKLVRQAPVDPTDGNVVNVYHTVNHLTTTDPEALKQYHTEHRIVVRRETVERAASSLGFIPSLESMAHYKERKFHGISESEIYEYAIPNKMNVMLEGPAGSGKTSSGEAFAARTGRFYASVPNNQQVDLQTLIGGFLPYGDGSKFRWVDGIITQAVRGGGVLNLGEINMMPANLSSRLHPLLDYRRTLVLMENGNEVIEAHPDLLIIADYNPNYRGTKLMNEAFKDRFEIKLQFPYDETIERGILKSESVIDLAKRMRKASSPMFGASSASTSDVAFDTPISTRILKTFEKVASELSYDLAVDIFINNFSEEERSSVRVLLDGMEFNIKSDLGFEVAGNPTEESVEV